MRPLIAAIGLVACFLGFGICQQAGRVRLLVNHRKDASLLPSTDKAVRLSPSDPETHYARAMVLWRMQRLPEAIKEYEKVVMLRPGDYVPWLDLGSARDKSGDADGALMAFKEAVRLAPYYGEPRWELGRLLLRAGRRDDAFVELRQAAISDPTRLPDVVSLVWETLRGDARAVQLALALETAQARMTLARFFVEHGEFREAMELFRSASGISNRDRRPLLTALLIAKRFAEAYEIWASGREAGSVERHHGTATITDGSFEEDISLDDPGFGWQLANNLQGLRISLDTTEPHTGAYSVRLDWNGNPDPSTPVISQLVLVEPTTRYRLTFAARTKELLTIGLPFVVVIDASDKKESVLTQSKGLQGGTTGWQDYITEFTTSENTGAVVISIRREACPTPECAILGSLWLDDFLLERL